MTTRFGGEELAERMAEIEKGQQLAGHFPDQEALDRARSVLTGEATHEEALAELEAKYAKHTEPHEPG